MMTDASDSPRPRWVSVCKLGSGVGLLTSQESQLREAVCGAKALK